MGQDIGLFKHGLLAHTLNQRLVELLLVVLLYQHYVNLVLQVVVALLLRVLEQEAQPLLDVPDVLVGWGDFYEMVRID